MLASSKLVDFSGETISVGIDVHKSSWSVTIRYNGYEQKTFSQPPYPDKLIAYLNKHFPNGNYNCVYEAGFCGFWIQRELEKLNANCIIVNAADVPTTDKEKRTKSDKIDSRKLARCLEVGTLTPIYIPDEQLEDDRMILRCRTQLVKDSTRMKNRIKQHLFRQGVENTTEYGSWTKKYIQWLEALELRTEQAKKVLNLYLRELETIKERLKEIEKEIRALTKEVRYARNYYLLNTIPGVGLVTAMVLLTEIGDMKRFKSLDKFCSFVGLIPNTSSTASKEIIGPMTRRGNAFIKRVIIESAWTIIRLDPAMGKAYKEYKKAMKGNKAIIRIAKKLLSRIRRVLLNDCEYQTGIN